MRILQTKATLVIAKILQNSYWKRTIIVVTFYR